MNAPVIEFGLLAPMIVVALAAIVCLLVEAFAPRSQRQDAQVVLTLVGLAAALVVVVINWIDGKYKVAAMGSVTIDGPTYMIWTILLVFGLLTTLLFAERRLHGDASTFTSMAASVPGSSLEREAAAEHVEHTEVYPLMMFSLFGMMLFSAGNDLITLFVALEMFSLPLYLLVGLARRRRLISQEASLKYFLLGSLSSAIFLYGSALVYGAANSFTFANVDAAITTPPNNETLMVTGMALVSVGVLFKIGAVPFHNWVPDVYLGSPTPVTAFMAVCTKLAAFGALLRVLYVAFGGMRWDWQLVVAVVAVATMVVGSVLTVTQLDVKRMLANSSIAHAGFILVGVVGAVTTLSGLPSGALGSVAATMTYMLAYGFATMGAFGCLTLVRKAGGEATALASWQGLGRRHPVVGVLMTLFMLSFAGIPLTGGFIGKLASFVSAWQGGWAWLVLVGVLFSLVSAFAYFRLIVVMFFREPIDDAVETGNASAATWIVIWLSAIGTLATGIIGGPVIEMFSAVADFLR